MLDPKQEMPNLSDVRVSPEQLAKQVPWKDLEGVVIIAKKKAGEKDQLYMSAISVNDLAFMNKQLDAHVNALFGFMDEGF